VDDDDLDRFLCLRFLRRYEDSEEYPESTDRERDLRWLRLRAPLLRLSSLRLRLLGEWDPLEDGETASLGAALCFFSVEGLWSSFVSTGSGDRDLDLDRERDTDRDGEREW
jgi:hypothetical protein